MEDTKKESLVEAVRCAKITELPEEFKESKEDKRYWINAIALVGKKDLSHNYVLMERDAKGKPMVVRDFGRPAIITSIDAIYPYMFLDKSLIPKFNTVEDIKQYLISNYGMEHKQRIENATNQQLKLLLYKFIESKQGVLEKDKIMKEEKELEEKKAIDTIKEVSDIPTVNKDDVAKEIQERKVSKRGRKPKNK